MSQFFRSLGLSAFAGVAGIAMFLVPPLARAAPLELEIVDRASGEVLPVHRFRGRQFVAGEPGREFELRLRNRSSDRLLAVTSVDGVNVIDGRSARVDQGGYVLDAWQSVTIDGWRKSLDEVAAFYFTSLRDSYAARTHRPRDVGVVGVAVFRERAPRRGLASESPARSSNDAADEVVVTAGAAAPSAASERRLGTGHGRRSESHAERVHFERASSTPDAIVELFYDSEHNLIAQGVIRKQRVAGHRPDPFPGEFVPDP